MMKREFGRTDADLARAEEFARDQADSGGVFRVVEVFEGAELIGIVFVVDDEGHDELQREYDSADELLSFGVDPTETQES